MYTITSEIELELEIKLEGITCNEEDYIPDVILMCPKGIMDEFKFLQTKYGRLRISHSAYLENDGKNVYLFNEPKALFGAIRKEKMMT